MRLQHLRTHPPPPPAPPAPVGGNFFRFELADAQALSRNLAPGKLAIGQSVTRGLGAGGVPSVGRKAAEESMDDLSE